jgi:hypothetical protein
MILATFYAKKTIKWGLLETKKEAAYICLANIEWYINKKG